MIVILIAIVAAIVVTQHTLLKAPCQTGHAVSLPASRIAASNAPVLAMP